MTACAHSLGNWAGVWAASWLLCWGQGLPDSQLSDLAGFDSEHSGCAREQGSLTQLCPSSKTWVTRDHENNSLI